MNEAPVSGTEGYAQEADALFKQYEALSFPNVHRHVFHLFPTTPSLVLEIGAGTGRDAAGFAALGHRVVAVEPTEVLRTGAARLHPSARIEWLNDSLPELALVRARGEQFDVVMLTAVWMHLDANQRRRAMPHVASLVRTGGVMIMSLRHGPVPAGRRMFDVSADETIRLAESEGLRPVLSQEHASVQPGREGVSWTRLAFRHQVSLSG